MLLKVEGLVARYGPVQVLHGVDLAVDAGSLVAIVGANGAGKSTLLRTLSGVHPAADGRVEFAGQDITGWPPHRRVAAGIAQVPEGRQVFAPLSVADNLRLGGIANRNRKGQAAKLEEVYALFPELEAKRHEPAWQLSGGQQQMLAIGRALMAEPRLLLLDEPSMGLAPLLAEQILATVKSLAEQGVPILLVEQNAYAALSIAERGYVLETGRVVLEDTGQALMNNKQVQHAYLGM